MTYKFEELQEQFISNLENAVLPQCHDKLYDGTGYCCLGLACMTVYGDKEKYDVGKIQKLIFDNESLDGFCTVKERLNLRGGLGEIKFENLSEVWEERVGEANSLASLNDDLKWDFPTIGMFIRENPEAVFSDF